MCAGVVEIFYIYIFPCLDGSHCGHVALGATVEDFDKALARAITIRFGVPVKISQEFEGDYIMAFWGTVCSNLSYIDTVWFIRLHS